MQKLRDENYTIVENINKEPFIKATQSVREKFGSKHKDLLSRIDAIK